MKRGYYGIGIENMKTVANLGTLWRSAYCLGASFIFVIGERYKHQASDTPKAYKSIPFYHYDTFEEFYKSIPKDCDLVGVDNVGFAVDLKEFKHPERAIYLLGAEDLGLSENSIDHCTFMIQFESKRCLNVAVAGSIIMYDRNLKS